MRKFPLQLLILLVVGNSIDRSTESSGKPGSKQGKEQSEELANTELGLWEPPGRRRGHTGEEEQGEAAGARSSGCFHQELHTGPGLALRSRDSTTTAQGKVHKRKTLLQIPSDVNKNFLAKPCSAQRKLRLF